MSYLSVSYVTSSKFTIGGETSAGTILLASSILSGHDCILEIASRGHNSGIAYCTATDTDSTGNNWTLIDDTPSRKGQMFWKKATDLTASKLVSVKGAVTSCAAGVSVYSGCSQGVSPITDILEQTNGGGVESHGSIVPGNAGSMVILTVYQHANDNLVSAQTCYDPGVLTSRYECLTTIGGSDCAVNHASALQVAGPASTGTFTWSQGNNVTTSMAYALRPGPVTDVAPTSSLSSPIHKYTQAGTYVVTLTATDNDGNSSATTGQVIAT